MMKSLIKTMHRIHKAFEKIAFGRIFSLELLLELTETKGRFKPGECFGKSLVHQRWRVRYEDG